MKAKIQLADAASYQALAEGENPLGQPRALQVLSRLAETVSTRLSVESVLDDALKHTLSTLNVEAGAITLVDEESHYLVFRAQRGWRVHNFVDGGVHLNPESGMTGLVMQSGRPIVSADAQHDPRITYGTFREEPVRALMMAPMRARGQALGILSVMSYEPRRFTTSEVALLTAVADQVGVAVDNARLYHSEQKRRRQAEQALARERRRAESLSLLRETSIRMSKTTSLTQVLNLVVQAALELSQAKMVQVDLYHEQYNQLALGVARRVDGSSTPLCLAPHRNPIAQKALHNNRMVNREIAEHADIFAKGLASVVVIPMTQQAAYGVIQLGYSQTPRLDEQVCTSLGLLADQACINLERLRLYTDLEQRNERLQRAYEKLQSLTQLKDEMIQNISHETRTPLTFIKGYVQLLLSDKLGNLTDEQRESLRLMSRKTDDLVRVVSQVSALEPLNADLLDWQPIVVQDVLTEVAALFERRLRSAALTLTVQPVAPALKLYGDLERIRQLCYNILDNAIKFSPNGGHIWMAANSEQNYIHLTFKDEGIGIPEERLDQIFDTFYQVDGSTTRQFGGVGVGLAVVHRIVDAHHGKVWAESDINRGSIFHVLLPRYREQSHSPAQKSGAQESEENR